MELKQRKEGKQEGRLSLTKCTNEMYEYKEQVDAKVWKQNHSVTFLMISTREKGRWISSPECLYFIYIFIYLFLIMWPLHKPWHNAGVALSLLFTLIPIVLFCVPDLVSCLRGVLFNKGYSVSPWLLLARIFHYWVLFQLPPVGIAKLKSDQVLAGWEEIMQLNTQLHSSPVLDNKWE